MEETKEQVIVNKIKSQDRTPKVKVYDFKRPDKFSKEQIRTISLMHETFARLITTSLSAQLRSLVHAHVSSVDQLTYEEFIRSIPNPTTLAIVNMSPLKGNAVLEIDPQITSSMIDRVFGGQGEVAVIDREHTNIEVLVIEKVIEPILGNLQEAWSTIIDLQPHLEQIETNPQFAQIVPPQEMIILVTLTVKIGDVEGMMNLCLPYITIESIVARLTAQYMYSTVNRKGRDGDTNTFQNILKAPAEIVLLCESLSLKQLGELKRGTLVRIPNLERGTARLRVGGVHFMNLTTVPPKCDNFTLQKSADQVEEQVRSAVKQTRRRDVDYLSEMVRTSVQELSTDFKGSFQQLDRSIGNLVRRQEEVVDNLYLSGHVDVPTDREFEAEETLRPFHFVSQDDLPTLFNFLSLEHPQTIALIASYLEPRMAADFLTLFDDQSQINLARRISMLDRTSPEVLRDLTGYIQSVLTSSQKTSHYRAGGIEAVVEILNVTPRFVEKTVIEGLEKSDPDLAEEIKKNMFVFEDIVLLADKAVERVIGKSANEDLAMSLKGVESVVQKKVFAAMDSERADTIRKLIAEIGPVRLRDVEASQMRIVGLIRQLEEAGEIFVARDDEQIV